MKGIRPFLRGLAVAAAIWAGAAWGGSPDLVISSITIDEGTTVYPGDTIKITSVTKNIGTASTGWWYYGDVYYYFGTRTNDLGNKIGEGWTPNANEPNGIDVDEEETDTLSSWTVPANTAPGTYYVICKADATGKCSESNENNNLKSVKITVRGIPSFKNVKWDGLRYVSDGDTAVAYGECVNIPAGSWVTVKIYEDDMAGDDLIGTWTVKTVQGTNGVYFAKTWSAKWEDDASGDPEYYFTCTYTAYGKTAEGNSGEENGTYLHVAAAEARMTPSPVHGDFYYDNDSGSGSSFTGASSGTAALTDDRIPIILVHGMSGDAKPKTLNYWYGWMNADPDGTLGYFNQAPMSNMFRVYRYVYDSTDFISTNAAKFATFVTNFYAHHPEFAERQVVIMAHSMGGLVSRYAMNTNPDFAAKVHRLVTLGSPHQGSQGANPTWIKYSGPDDDSWFISGVYNTFKLHNNTAGCFDLAWYNLSQIPAEALTESAISGMSDTYQVDLMRASLQNPFCGWYGMRHETANDYKMVFFGGSSTNRITDYLSKDWPDEPSGEVKTDHLGLWAATKIFRSMSYRDGTGVGDNDGLVPLNSALLTDFNAHPNTAKINLNTEDQEVDHASYLDAPVTMDSVKARLLTQVRGYCAPAVVANAARWRLVEPNANGPGPWQKSGVRLPALTPGATYTIQFKDVDGYNTPASVTFTAKSSVTKAITGTYTTAQAANHAPTGLALSNASVVDGAPAGTLVGTFSATDPDSNESFTYSLVSGEGDTGNAWFSISGNRLLTAKVFDYEEYPAHYCRVQVADSAGATHEEAFAIQIENIGDTPGEETGEGWFNLNWNAVPGATAYRVDVAACGGSATHVLPSATLGTNEFLDGQEWKYILPDGASAPSYPNGAVSNAPVYYSYKGSTTNIGHFLVGTNNIGIQTAPIPLDDADTVTLSFTNGAWNGGTVTGRVVLTASYRIDGGPWTSLGTSQPSSTGDGGEVAFSQTIDSPAGAAIEFKIEAPGACIATNANGLYYLRGGYVAAASVALSGTGVGNYAGGCRVAGFPATTTETSMRVGGLPVGEPYWHRVEAFVDGRWVAVASGSSVTVDTALAAPENLDATIVESDAFLLEWDAVAGADGYVVQITDVTAAGNPEVLSSCPNGNLSAGGNDSGWRYSANHSQVSSNWWFDSGSETANYHALYIAPNPGIQSPVLDLSGYSGASVHFVMRKRNLEVGTACLYWSTDGQTWNRGDSVSTNENAIYNNRFLEIAVPAEALVSNVRLELCTSDATGSGSIYAEASGVGIRNLTVNATPRGMPDYEAASVVEDVAIDASFIATDLTPETRYWFRVQAADNAGNVSEWANGETTTAAANSPPADLALSPASIRENLPAGTEIGRLTATDPDNNDEVSFSIVEGEGGDDNDYFAIGGANNDRLLSAAAFDYEMKTVRTVRIRASDKRGAFVEAAFEIAVLDETGEAVAIVPVSEIGTSVSMDDLLVDFAPADHNRVEFVWDEEGAAAWDIYISTNLQEGFFHYKRVYEPSWEDDLGDSPARFWIIQPVGQ